MGIIIYNGRSSKDFHIQVEHPPEYAYPEKDYIKTHVPGRNGDLVFDNNSYKNVDGKYSIAIGIPGQDFSAMANRISEWLHSASGYARLEDSYYPDIFRMAMYYEQNNVENVFQQGGRAQINFDCKPQKFLKLGEILVTIQNGSSIINPTAFASKPIINVYGSSGTLNISGTTITLNSIDSNVTLDCDTENAYKGATNCNPNIIAPTFPTLLPGENEISWSGDIAVVTIIPRWWTL